jgi:NAD(P)-dependent dehydrogenase (short-subunit alcohol dehydrogenase family)
LKTSMTNTQAQFPVCAVVGAGPGNGAASIRRFTAEGYAVAMIARSTAVMGPLATELSQARGYVCDVGHPGAVEHAFEAIAAELGPIDVLIYNAGKGVWGTAEEVSLENFEVSWRDTLGAFAAARGVIPAMGAKGWDAWSSSSLPRRQRAVRRPCPRP